MLREYGGSLQPVAPGRNLVQIDLDHVITTEDQVHRASRFGLRQWLPTYRRNPGQVRPIFDPLSYGRTNGSAMSASELLVNVSCAVVVCV